MTLFEQLILTLAQDLYGAPTIPHGAETIDVAPPWRRLPMLEGIREHTGVAPEAFATFEGARAAGESLGLDMTRESQTGGIIEKVHERFVQPHLIAPTFITEFPIETSPLAKKDPRNPAFVRRFEVLHRRPGDRECLLRDQRPGRSAGALSRTGAVGRPRRRGGASDG